MQKLFLVSLLLTAYLVSSVAASDVIEESSVRHKRENDTPNGSPVNEETENESRGLLSSFSNVASKKFHELSNVLKDTLNLHHEKIGSLHKTVQSCFQRLLNLEKTVLGLQEEKPTYDADYLTEKIKEIVSDYVNPGDLQSMSGYLQSQLRYLDYRLQTVDRYLALAFQHIKYLEKHRGGAPVPHYRPAAPAKHYGGLKYREGENETEPLTSVQPLV